VEARGGFEGEIGSTEHPLQTAHEVVVGEQPERAGFGKAEAELISEHRKRPRQQLLIQFVYLPGFQKWDLWVTSDIYVQ
jgi:hypothetical protein